MSEATVDQGAKLTGRQRTKQALLLAGLDCVAEENTDVAVLTITRAAGVGQGTFYNHFADKASFFRESVEFGVELCAGFIDEVAGGHEDPARSFGQGFRIMAGLHRRFPKLSQALIRRANSVYSFAGGFVARLRRDIIGGVEAGRFSCESVEGAIATVIGSAMMLGQRLHDDPGLDHAEVGRATAVDLLVMLGIEREEARAIVREPLPRGPLPDVLQAIADRTSP